MPVSTDADDDKGTAAYISPSVIIGDAAERSRELEFWLSAETFTSSDRARSPCRIIIF